MMLKLPPEFQAQLNKSVEHLEFPDPSDMDMHENAINTVTPKMRLKEYILATVATKSCTEFTFELEAAKYPDMVAFVHKMRVALYRQRIKLQKAGRKIKQFGMKIVSIVENPENPGFYLITLSTEKRRSTHKIEEIDIILDDLLCEDLLNESNESDESDESHRVT